MTTPEPTEAPEYAWNDPALEAAEDAGCPCGHVALDHAWNGCEGCACTRSAIHAALASGVVVTRPGGEACTCRPIEGREAMDSRGCERHRLLGLLDDLATQPEQEQS